MSQPWERAFLSDLAHGVGVDCGCGFAKIGRFGIDINPAATADLVCDMAHIPLASGSQAYIIACHSLEHCPDTIAILREWHRLLKPAGVVGVVVPDAAQPLVAIMGDSCRTHKQLFTAVTLPKFFAFCGFAIDRINVRNKSLALVAHKP